MSFQTINIGTVANDGTGDSLRAAAIKINANFAAASPIAGPGSGQAFAVGPLTAGTSTLGVTTIGLSNVNPSPLAANKTMECWLSDDTHLVIAVRGSDGGTRTVTLTLA